MAFLYITLERFGLENASSNRNLSFCKMLEALSKEVIVISLDEVESEKVHIYKNIKYITLRNASNTFTAKLFNLIFHKKRLKNCIEKLNKSVDIEGVFFYDIPFNSINYLKKFTKINNIKLFHDSVEWYSPEQFKWGKFALPYVLKNLLNKYVINKQIAVFAISSYLYNYFQLKGIRATRIPIMLDMNEIPFEKQIALNKLTLLYAGSPGKKDYLKEIVEGVGRLKKEELEQVELQIFGINKKQLIENCGISEAYIAKCGDSLKVHGRVTREEVLTQLKKADFTVLLRSPNLRYAKAGFPTKVVESLATATPVLCNLTSDLGAYLNHGKNSIIIEECSAESFEKALRNAIALSFEEKQLMSKNARQTAEEFFDYRLFKNQFKSFL